MGAWPKQAAPVAVDRPYRDVLRVGERAAARPVVSVDLEVRAHAGVDYDDGVGVSDDVAQAGLHSGLPGLRLLSWPNEVAEVDTAHR